MRGVEEEKKFDTDDLLYVRQCEPRHRKPMEEAVVAVDAEPAVRKRKPRRVVNAFGYLMRTIVLDGPLFLTLAVYYGLQWCNHVHLEYLHPLLNTMVFTNGRREREITYFTRTCDETDLSTLDGAELFLPETASTEEAYQHHLKHGFTVFRKILSEETAANLRAFIDRRNRQLREDEIIYVIENDNRYSFGLGTEEPTVVAALKEITHNDRLRGAVEKILGPNPALIEMTAITSSYGAIDQYYHDDVIPVASAIRYSRTFGPSYSLFIQLQNTTKEMGATGACPGTHYCSGDFTDALCEKVGFQLVGEEGHWGVGDALLMNMNSFHRGAAHTDPNALDRVMLILTFVPQPRERAESRLMSQGITFSLRWDMWGHTWNDLAHADTAMTQPWATLRALGLYKPSNAVWGIDFITGCMMRLANEDYGFKDYELEELIDAGGIKWLPKFLHADYKEAGGRWYEYLQDCFYNTLGFWELVTRSVVCGYISIYLLMSAAPNKEGRLSCIGNAVLRLAMMWCLVYLIYNAAKSRVDSTGWATDVKAKRRYNSVFVNEVVYGVKEWGIKAIPNRHDVLIENRFGSKYLAMYEDFISGHPANRLYEHLIEGDAATYRQYPGFLKEATAKYIVGAVEETQGRFLKQGPNGQWYQLNEADCLAQVNRDLIVHSNSIVQKLVREIRRLCSDYMYGIYTDTALSQRYAVPHLKAIERALLQQPSQPIATRLTTPASRDVAFIPFQIDPVELRDEVLMPSPRNKLPPAFRPEEPFDGAWVAIGDTLEHAVDGYWYVGVVEELTAHAEVQLSYPEHDYVVTVQQAQVRRFVPYSVDDTIEVLGYDQEYHYCTVIHVNPDGTYDVKLDEVEKDDETGGTGIYQDVQPYELRSETLPGEGVVGEYKSAYG